MLDTHDVSSHVFASDQQLQGSKAVGTGYSRIQDHQDRSPRVLQDPATARGPLFVPLAETSRML